VPQHDVFAFNARCRAVQITGEQANRRKFRNADAKTSNLHFAIESLVKVLDGLIADVGLDASGHPVGEE
jgi:hypothetical protein